MDLLENLIWETYFSGNKNEYGEDVLVDNNNIVITGSTESYAPNNNSAFYLASYDDSGNLLWYQIFAGNISDRAYGFDIDADNDFYIAGETQSWAMDAFGDAMVIKLSSFQRYTDIIEIIVDINGFVSGAAITGVFIGGTILSPPNSPPSEGSASSQVSMSAAKGDGRVDIKSASDDRKVELGFKKPGKWFKKKKFKMYFSSLMMGIVLSILFSFIFYPIVFSSSVLTVIASILAPTGFFYGLFNFSYVGIYQHKLNLYNAYYKNKKKFFFDILSWLKPFLFGYSIYSSINLFLLLTSYNLLFFSLIFVLIGISIGGLLLISIKYFK